MLIIILLLAQKKNCKSEIGVGVEGGGNVRASSKWERRTIQCFWPRRRVFFFCFAFFIQQYFLILQQDVYFQQETTTEKMSDTVQRIRPT